MFVSGKPFKPRLMFASKAGTYPSEGTFRCTTLGFTNRHTNKPGNSKGGSITIPLNSCLTGLELAVWQLTIFVFICKTDQSKSLKQEVNTTVILPPLVFPAQTLDSAVKAYQGKHSSLLVTLVNYGHKKLLTLSSSLN